MHRDVALAISVLALLLLPASRPATAQPGYQFTIIDGPGASGTYAFGVTNQGLVTGYYAGADGAYHGYVWTNGVLTTVDHPGSVDTLLGPMSERGICVGNYDNGVTGPATLVDLSSGEWFPLPEIPGYALSNGNGISDSGLVTGSVTDGNSNNGVGWFWDGSAYTLFTPPGATGLFGTYPSGINNKGEIAGFYQDGSGVFHGFLKEGDSYTTIDYPGAVFTQAWSINNQGDIVGRYRLPDGSRHGYVLHRGVFKTVDVPGATRTGITYIDDRGDLAGFIQDSAFTFHGFVAIKQ